MAVRQNVSHDAGCGVRWNEAASTGCYDALVVSISIIVPNNSKEKLVLYDS